MLHEMVAKEVIDALAQDETACKHVPMLKDASDVMRALHGEEEQEETITPQDKKKHHAKPILLASTALAGYGAFGFGKDTLFARGKLVDMMMRDKDLPAELVNNNLISQTFANKIKRHKSDYLHHASRSSPLDEMATDIRKSWTMRIKLAEGVANEGVSRLDAMKQYRITDRLGLVRNATIALLGVAGMGVGLRKLCLDQERSEQHER